MADPRHLELLKQGADSWNAFRASSGESADLVDADLSGMDLSGADLDAGNLFRAQLGNAKLRGASLKGAIVVEAYLLGADLEGADLSSAMCVKSILHGAKLGGAVLRDVEFAEVTLSSADLRGATIDGKTSFFQTDLSGAKLANQVLGGRQFHDVDLWMADLREADLRGASLRRAVMVRADLRGSDLTGADLQQVNLQGADLRGATFADADLSATSLVRAKVEGARFSGARVYGISVWDLEGTPASEADLVVTPAGAPAVTVSDLEVAQFVYLLLSNQKIRDVIDTVTTKTVLILGRFSDQQKPILDSIRSWLRGRDYVPVLFDFDKPSNQDLTGTVETLARMARFVIADLTDPSSIPHELGMIVPYLRKTPVQLLRKSGTGGYGMVQNLLAYPWVLAPHEYADGDSLLAELPTVLAPAEAKVRELRGE